MSLQNLFLVTRNETFMQFGGLKGPSTTHALVSLICGAVIMVRGGRGSVSALLFDFAEAFDTVDYNTLLAKLKYRQLPHCLVR